MANLLDYLSAYASKTFSEMPFTEVDNLILSRLAYGKLENTSIRFPARCSDVLNELLQIYTGQDKTLITLFAASVRFRDTILFAPRAEWAEEETLQFAAVTYLLSDNTAYVAYRGTDNTLVGWKEDFNLSFISPIPAQAEAKEYLDSVGTVLGCPLRVGGHSKGGNLAVYASAHANESIRALITAVYNNDGPGQDEKTVLSDGYKEISGRIRTFLPKSSVVGMLLEYSRDFYVVDSDARGIFQHNPYTWLTEDDSFSYVSSTTLFSMHLSSTIRIWLKGLSSEERKRIIDIVFDVLEAGNVRTLGEIKSNAAAMIRVIRAARDMKPEDRKLLTELTLEFLRASRQNFERITAGAKKIRESIQNAPGIAYSPKEGAPSSGKDDDT